MAASHTIKKGETLWEISKIYYGQGDKWTLIYNENKNLLTSADMILAGGVLKIPDLHTASLQDSSKKKIQKDKRLKLRKKALHLLIHQLKA